MTIKEGTGLPLRHHFRGTREGRRTSLLVDHCDAQSITGRATLPAQL